MDLKPKLPPGRANRKALAFNAEIIRLRRAGYSFAAIRQALREAGVEVGLSTVKREAVNQTTPVTNAWRGHAPPSSPALASAPIHPSLPEPSSPSLAPASYVGESRSGKEIAEAFMKGRITNPLLQERGSK